MMADLETNSSRVLIANEVFALNLKTARLAGCDGTEKKF